MEILRTDRVLVLPTGLPEGVVYSISYEQLLKTLNIYGGLKLYPHEFVKQVILDDLGILIVVDTEK